MIFIIQLLMQNLKSVLVCPINVDGLDDRRRNAHENDPKKVEAPNGNDRPVDARAHDDVFKKFLG